MAKHSKWAQIKRQKEVVDKKRGQAFTKLARAITSAVAQGGEDPEANAALRLAINRAISTNMPKENITRAIARAVKAKSEGTTATFEAYGPHGSALMIFTLTDNRNRTIAELRSLLQKNEGNLATSGSVAWQFEPCAIITIEDTLLAEEIELALIEKGAKEIMREGSQVHIITNPSTLETVSATLRDAHIPFLAPEISSMPKQTIDLPENQRRLLANLITQLQNHPDVIKVVTNIQ
jgi:YebC/PmpR family DNA-binding regulatory protein